MTCVGDQDCSAAKSGHIGVGAVPNSIRKKKEPATSQNPMWWWRAEATRGRGVRSVADGVVEVLMDKHNRRQPVTHGDP